jgi:glutathione S-transferase
MPELEIIGASHSTYVRAVRIALEEKGVAYTLLPVRPHTPEADAIHPFGKIPSMRHGERRLFESKAIATYADKMFPGPSLFPEAPYACGMVEQWVSTLNTTMSLGFSDYLRAHFFSGAADGTPDRSAIERVLPIVRNNLTMLDKVVSADGYLVNDCLTYADMAFMPWLSYLHDLPESGEIIAEMKNLAAYFSRLSERPSFINTVPLRLPGPH